jgi:hypothetical protein
MIAAHRDLIVEVVCKRFYVEKLSKAQIAKELGLARNTVRSYLKAHPENSPQVQAILAAPSETTPVSDMSYEFLNFQVSLQNAVSSGDPNLKHLNLLQTVKNHAEELRIESLQDLIKLEVAYENYLLYRCMSKRYMEMNGQCLDVSWVERTDKMTKFTSRYAEAAQKFLKIYCDLTKELEIKYGKRSPDIGRIQNLNIQRNEFTLTHASS